MQGRSTSRSSLMFPDVPIYKSWDIGKGGYWTKFSKNDDCGDDGWIEGESKWDKEIPVQRKHWNRISMNSATRPFFSLIFFHFLFCRHHDSTSFYLMPLCTATYLTQTLSPLSLARDTWTVILLSPKIKHHFRQNFDILTHFLPWDVKISLGTTFDYSKLQIQDCIEFIFQIVCLLFDFRQALVSAYLHTYYRLYERGVAPFITAALCTHDEES